MEELRLILTDKHKLFIELWANKEETGKSADEIALEVGISRKTCYNWAGNKEIQEDINKIVISKLDAKLPMIAHKTQQLINSDKSNDVVKGIDAFWNLQNKLSTKENLGSRAVEFEKFEKGMELYIRLLPELYGTDAIGQKLGAEMVGMALAEEMRRKKVDNFTEADLNKWLREQGY